MVQLMSTDATAARAERYLSLLLTLSGGVMLLALPAALLPTAWMAASHTWLGLGTFAPSPLTEYLTRSISVLYAVHGGLLLLVARDVQRFVDIIMYLALAHMLFGATMLFIDLHAGMPPLWTAGEGPLILGAGGLMWVLVRSVRRAS